MGGAIGGGLGGPMIGGLGSAITSSYEPEGETVEESEKLAQGASDRARKLGAMRRKKQGSNRGMYKSERAGYNLSQSQRSQNASLETQRGPQTGGGPKSFGFARNKSNPIKSKTYAGSGNKAKRRMDSMKSEAYEVNQADKTGNTKAYQGYKAGQKNKLTGEPLYKKGNMKEAVLEKKTKTKKKYGRGEKIGRVVGGIGGSVGGGIAGAGAGMGVGSLATGVAGGVAGDYVGTKVGGAVGKAADKVGKGINKLRGKSVKKEDLENISKFNVDGNSYRNEKDAINEILGATIGGAVGGKLGGDLLMKKGMGKVAARAVGAGVGAAGGEMLDPFKKGEDKSPLTAGIVGGAVGAASPRIAKGFKKVHADVSAKNPVKPIKDPMKTDFNTSPNKNIA